MICAACKLIFLSFVLNITKAAIFDDFLIKLANSSYENAIKFELRAVLKLELQ